MAWAAPRGLVGPETLAIGVAHDDPGVTPADKVRHDACLTVGDSSGPEGEVGVKQTDHVAAYLAGQEDIKRKAGVQDLAELRQRPLEDCDIRAQQVGLASPRNAGFDT